MTLRLATPADIPRLIEIRGAVRENRLRDPASIGAGDYAPYVEDRRCWLWDEAGTVLGFAALDPASPLGLSGAAGAAVWALFVVPQAQGRGIGRALLGALVADARRLGLAALTLSTEKGSRAEAFYREAGWRGAGRDAHGDTMLALSL